MKPAPKAGKWTVTVWQPDNTVKRHTVMAPDKERAVCWVRTQHGYAVGQRIAVCRDAALIGERVLTGGGLAAIIAQEWTRRLNELIGPV